MFKSDSPYVDFSSFPRCPFFYQFFCVSEQSRTKYRIVNVISLKQQRKKLTPCSIIQNFCIYILSLPTFLFFISAATTADCIQWQQVKTEPTTGKYISKSLGAHFQLFSEIYCSLPPSECSLGTVLKTLSLLSSIMRSFLSQSETRKKVWTNRLGIFIALEYIWYSKLPLFRVFSKGTTGENVYI